MKKSREKNKRNKIAGKVLVALCLVVIVILIIIIALLLRKPEEPKRNVVVNEKNAEIIAAQMSEEDYVEPGYYTVNMETEWHFAKGDTISDDARVDNVVGNTNPIYFDVFLEGKEEETIYRSPVIPVGSYLENIALDTTLGAGEYDCVMVYHLVDEEQNTISTLRVAFKITVES